MYAGQVWDFIIIVAVVLFLFRKIYGEVVELYPVHTTYFLNTCL
jgi:hypothetical protein